MGSVWGSAEGSVVPKRREPRMGRDERGEAPKRRELTPVERGEKRGNRRPLGEGERGFAPPKSLHPGDEPDLPVEIEQRWGDSRPDKPRPVRGGRRAAGWVRLGKRRRREPLGSVQPQLSRAARMRRCRRAGPMRLRPGRSWSPRMDPTGHGRGIVRAPLRLRQPPRSSAIVVSGSRPRSWSRTSGASSRRPGTSSPNRSSSPCCRR